MQRNRLIPILLLKNNLLYKSINFKDYVYVGDPINTVRIFNDKEVDELVILDIDATKNKKEPNFQLIQSIASEAFMPIAYGGGITSLVQVKQLIDSGLEKIILNSSALNNDQIISDVSQYIGSQSTVVSIDVKQSVWGKYKVFSHSSQSCNQLDLLEYIKRVQNMGAGELIINSVDKDGRMNGYDLKLFHAIKNQITVPLVMVGGASGLENIRQLFELSDYVSAGVGSFFIFHGKHRAVLVTYPSFDEISTLYKIESSDEV